MSIPAASTETVYRPVAANLGPYATLFPYEKAADIAVYLDIGAGARRLTLGSDFQLTASTNALVAGGYVTLSGSLLVAGAWPAGSLLALVRTTQTDQPSVFGEIQQFSPKAVEQAIDHVTRQVQDLRSRFKRALLLTFGSVIPTLRNQPSTVLGFDGAGNFAQVPFSALTSKGDPGGNSLAAGLFTDVGALNVPVGTDLIQTSGFGRKGRGLARYAATTNVGQTAFRRQTANGRWFELAETSVSVDMFGAIGDGVTDDTAALLSAHAYWAANPSVELVYPGGVYLISQALPLPNTSLWTLRARGSVELRQSADNTIIFELLATAALRGWRILGNFSFSWVNDQPVYNTNAVAIALGSTLDLSDGLYGWEIDCATFFNGYRGIAVHPATLAANRICPFWGWTIRTVTSFRAMSGGTLVLYSPNQNVGAPRAELQNFYAQGENAQEPRLVLQGYTALKLGNIEFNLGSGTQMLLQNNRQIVIDNLRIEQATTHVSGEKLFSFAGVYTQCLIRNLEVQSHTVDIGAGHECYVIDSYQGVVTVENFITYFLTVTSGLLYLCSSTGDGRVQIRGDWFRTNEGDTFLYPIAPAPTAFAHDKPQGVEFWLSDVEPALNFAPMSNAASDNEFLIPAGCWLVAVMVYLDAPLSAGQLQVFAYKNGLAVAGGQYGATLNPGAQTGSRYHPLYKGFFIPDTSHRLEAFDRLSMRIVTTGDYAPAANLCKVVALLAYTPR